MLGLRVTYLLGLVEAFFEFAILKRKWIYGFTVCRRRRTGYPNKLTNRPILGEIFKIQFRI